MVITELNLSEYGFLSTQLDYSAMRTLFIREYPDRFDVVSINHGISKFGEARLFINPTYIAFNAVNEILAVVGKNTGFNHYLGMLSPTVLNHPLFDKKAALGMEIQNTIVVNNHKIHEENLLTVLDQIKFYLITHLFPFFKGVQSLQYINEGIPDVLTADCFPMESANMVRLIIMKLFRNENYADFLAKREEKVEIPELYRSIYEQRVKQFQWLRNYLETDQESGFRD